MNSLRLSSERLRKAFWLGRSSSTSGFTFSSWAKEGVAKVSRRNRGNNFMGVRFARCLAGDDEEGKAKILFGRTNAGC